MNIKSYCSEISHLVLIKHLLLMIGTMFYSSDGKQLNLICDRTAFSINFGGGKKSNNIRNRNNNKSNNNLPPRPPRDNSLFSNLWDYDGDDNDGNNAKHSKMMFDYRNILLGSMIPTDDTNELDYLNVEGDDVDNNIDDLFSYDDAMIHCCRGGSTTTSKPKSSSKQDQITKGSKTTLSMMSSYWSDAFDSFSHVITSPIHIIKRKVLPKFRSKEEKDRKAYAKTIEELSSIPVTSITAPNSTVLPPQVLQIAAKRSGLLGGPLNQRAVMECARAIKQWYMRKGYVLHAVTGATLQAETGTAVLAVQEPILSKHEPVDITFAKEMVFDEELDNKIVSYRQYRDRRLRRKERNIAKPNELNTTFVPTTGRTRANAIAKALQLEGGKPFRWNEDKWKLVLTSGIFRRVLRASPQPLNDGTVQLQIICQEPSQRNLEYGVSKSLYTGEWEGELDFTHGNLLGAGETLGLLVKRGAKDSDASFRLTFRDAKFGLGGGYDIEAFNEHISIKNPIKSGVSLSNTIGNGIKDADDHSNHNTDNSNLDHHNLDTSFNFDDIAHTTTINDDDDDEILCRKGATFRIRNPLPAHFAPRSLTSTSLERTSTRTGHHESIGSTTLDLGPFRKELPFYARTNLLTSLTIGTRLGDTRFKNFQKNKKDSSSLSSQWELLPYTSAKATTSQIIPLTSIANNNNDNEIHRSIVLALQHSIITSSQNLPLHEANAAGFAARVRGYPNSSNKPISASMLGTTELRIPITLPIANAYQDASLVIFGDWLLASSYRSNSAGAMNRYNDKGKRINKSSLGIGLRKSLKGIPVKYDVSITRDGKIGAFFGLGADFDV
mmetsp:Transcript_1885/g.2710  ORF Transcript_1885/g.2710 Transcript_1885/m.2710 type:complete len:835 (+) Transcript_1885:244-2748(+)|eukprot:CAMPEP_0184869990 /NCGR_PEP_ID=MMETSP0580-20130426/36080_1 /TAXON_ID=1118495 /ORGANISM="Dactyliosolen fragilissimus" /LENGTH=834 /DNA_ID=CAMNT_0027371849 /DNA_START=156 /DNA_END=2660 /DNA_ORIENTATION=-